MGLDNNQTWRDSTWMYWECQNQLVLEEDIAAVEDCYVMVKNTKHHFLNPEAGRNTTLSKTIEVQKYYTTTYR